MTERQLDELREAVRVATEHDSVRGVADRARLSHETVYAFLRGEPVSPKSLVRLRNAVTSDSAPAVVAGAASTHGLLLTEREYGRLLGTLETMERWVGSAAGQVTAFATTVTAVVDGLHAMRVQLDQIGQTTNSVAEMVRGAPAPPPPAGPTTPDRPVLDPGLFRTQDEAMRDRDADSAREAG